MSIQTPPQMFYQQDITPDREEKRSIRKIYNRVGIVLLAAYFFATIVCSVCYDLFSPEPKYDETGAWLLDVTDSIIGGCLPAVCSIIVFIVYCLIARYNPKELFRRENVRGGEVIRTALSVLMLQQVSLFVTIFLSSALYSIGLGVPSANIVYEHTPSVYAVNMFSSVILAPVAEELLYRGIILRCTARVSRRFAIFFSAFVFGIMHGNPYQFVLGFMTGILLAIITIRTGSIIPAIVCHMINNFMAEGTALVEYFNPEASYAISIISIPVLLIAGVIAFVIEIMSGRMKLPEYTAYHKKRTLPIIITSWSVIAAMLFFAYDLIMSIQPIAVLPTA